MGLVNRKPRPLARDTDSLRDDRLFIVACDDTYAPKQYFGFFRVTRVQIHVVPTEDSKSAAKYVLDRLLAFEYELDDERWLLLDVDHCTSGGHLQSFMTTLGDARRRGINIALSKPCFEFWLLLHHRDAPALAHITNAQQAEQELRQVLGQYNKRRLRQADFSLLTVCDACFRAQALDASVDGGDNPVGITSRVYLLWNAILASVAPSQLPAELKRLLKK